MSISSEFFTESTNKKVVKIDQYLVKIWSKCNSLLFWGYFVEVVSDKCDSCVLYFDNRDVWLINK